MTPSYYIASVVYRFRLRPLKSLVRSLGSTQMVCQVPGVPVLTFVSGHYYVPGIGSRAGEIEGECWQKDHAAGEHHPRDSFQMEPSAASIDRAGRRMDPG